jgi:G3E family GTPase
MKGILAFEGRARKHVFHSVHMTFEGEAGEEWAVGEPRRSRLVAIGRGLRRGELRRGLEACKA